MNRKLTLLVGLLIVSVIISFKVGMNIGDRMVIDNKYKQVTDALNEYNEKNGIINRFEEEEVRDDKIMLDFLNKLDNPRTIERITDILANNKQSIFNTKQGIHLDIIEGNVETLHKDAVHIKKLETRNINTLKYANIFVLSLITALIFSQLERKYILPTILLMSLIGVIIVINII